MEKLLVKLYFTFTATSSLDIMETWKTLEGGSDTVLWVKGTIKFYRLFRN